jgi:microcystin-dependent protein
MADPTAAGPDDRGIPMPLRLSFVGTDTILALGASYPNTLVVEVANVSVSDRIVFDPSGDAPSRLVLSADVQPPGERRDWALGTASEVAAIVPRVDDGRWQTAANQQGARPEWAFTPTGAVVLDPGQSFTISLTDVTSSLPEGTAWFTLACRGVTGFADADLALPVRKSRQCIAGAPMSGGGTLRWEGPGGRFSWSARFRMFLPLNPNPLSTGYVDVDMPLSDIPSEHVHDGIARSVTAAGVELRHGEALYAVHDLGPGSSPVSFRLVYSPGFVQATGNWRLIAAVNGDDGTLLVGSGIIMSARTSSSHGSPIPIGTILMWSGVLADVPDGWALCDGSNGTPDLRDRFVVGAGAAYAPGTTGGSDAVALTVDQLASHQHGAWSSSEGAHQHWMEGTNAGGLANRVRTIPGETTVKMEYGGGRNPDPGTQMWRGHVNTDVQGGHAHGIGISPSGGGQPHENRPPFLALAYIMKT